MIYLVSKIEFLFKSELFKRMSPEEAIQKLSQETLLGADTETMGLDPYTKDLLTIQLGTEEYQIVWDCKSYDIQLLKPILENPNIKTIWWNAAFDLKFLYHQNIWPSNVYDGMLAEQLLYLGYPIGYHSMSLKTAGMTYCNIELDKTVRGKITTVGLSEDVVVYAANDVKYEIPIYNKQREILEQKELIKASDFENEFVKVLAYIEYCGVKLDVPRWKKKMTNDEANFQKAKKALDDYIINKYKSDNNFKTEANLEEEFVAIEYNTDGSILIKHRIPTNAILISRPYRIHKESGDCECVKIRRKTPLIYIEKQGDLFSGFNTEPQCAINWSSSKQVIPLFEQLGFKLDTFDKKTKKKKKSVEGPIIKSQLDVDPIAQLYLDYKASAKVVESFGQNFLDAINPKTGRIHASFHQLGTDTGRLSCGGGEAQVNVQQLPHDAETRACFIAEPGNLWISADYQSQESRLIASVSNDQAMIDLFLNGCGDVHSLVAKMSYPEQIGDCPIEEIKHKFKGLRQEAKGIEFAINYGGDANTISNNKSIPLKEAQVIYDNYMKGFSGVSAYQNYCRLDVMEKGYILLNPITKHKAFIPDKDFLLNYQKKMTDPEFWKYYNEMKKVDRYCDTVTNMRRFMRLKSQCEKHAINYRIDVAVVSCLNPLNSVKPVAKIK